MGQIVERTHTVGKKKKEKDEKLDTQADINLRGRCVDRFPTSDLSEQSDQMFHLSLRLTRPPLACHVGNRLVCGTIVLRNSHGPSSPFGPRYELRDSCPGPKTKTVFVVLSFFLLLNTHELST